MGITYHEVDSNEHDDGFCSQIFACYYGEANEVEYLLF